MSSGPLDDVRWTSLPTSLRSVWPVAPLVFADSAHGTSDSEARAANLHSRLGTESYSGQNQEKTRVQIRGHYYRLANNTGLLSLTNAKCVCATESVERARGSSEARAPISTWRIAPPAGASLSSLSTTTTSSSSRCTRLHSSGTLEYL